MFNITIESLGCIAGIRVRGFKRQNILFSTAAAAGFYSGGGIARQIAVDCFLSANMI
jgi:hypothetical protein